MDQSPFDIRCEWGEPGVRALSALSDVIIIVDVLSFSTCVSIAVGRGALIFPYRLKDETRFAFARSVNAEVASSRGEGGYSLSPASLLAIPACTRLILPSPNGATLSLATGKVPTFAGCLRNCRAVAQTAMRCGTKISVIPAGERWGDDGSIRFAAEDLIGAGAVISELGGSRSPEAQLAEAAFQQARERLPEVLAQSGSGRELADRGFKGDIVVAAELNGDSCTPSMLGGAFRNRHTHARYTPQ